MADGIQRAAMILGSVAVLAVTGWMTADQLSRPIAHASPEDAGAADAGALADGGGEAGPASAESADASVTLENGDGGLSLLGLQLDAGAMPSSAPRSVKLGVVLVQFAGAEGATSSRNKSDAMKHALELMEQAKSDFKGAVKAGDTGSSEDIGRIPRGVLEQPTELAVFSLAAGDVSEPLETPRGYWVVKRLE